MVEKFDNKGVKNGNFINQMEFRKKSIEQQDIKKMFQQTNQGIVFKIKVIPKASFSECIAWENDELKIRLAAVPNKGKANSELIDYLAELFNIGKSKIELIQGEASRHKRVCIKGIAVKEIELKIQNCLSKRKLNQP